MQNKQSARTLTVYIRSGCLTCKRALDYLSARKIDLQTIEIFKQPLSQDRIRLVLRKAGVSPQRALRGKDKMFKQLQLDKRRLTDKEIVSLMEKYPGLILRPIVVYGDKAVIATKPEMIDQLLAK